MYSVDLKLKEAEKFFRKNDFKKAKFLLIEILNKYPKNLRAKNCLSLINEKKNKLSDFEFSNFLEKFNNGEYLYLIDILKNKLIEYPNEEKIINLLASSFLKIENFDDAEFFLKKALENNPNSTDLKNNLAVFYKRRKKNNLAIRLFLEILNHSPNESKVLNNIGNAFIEKGDFKKGKMYLKKAISVDPKFPQPIHNLGVIYREKKEHEKAIKLWKKALKLDPLYRDAMINIGDSYKSLNKIKNAQDFYNSASSLKEDDIILNKIGLINFEKGNIKEAEIFYKKALFLNNNNADSHFNLAILLMSIGFYVPGFKKYHWRWKVDSFDSKLLVVDKPKWKLEKNKIPVIWPEQGIGDQIFLSRFFNDLPPQDHNIKIVLDPKLIDYYKTCFSNHDFQFEVSSKDIDSHLPIGDLPEFFIKTISDVKKRSGPYLKVDKQKAKSLRSLLPKGKKICGISWISKHNLGDNKSLSLEMLKDILLLDNITFVDLQYSDTSDERNKFFKDYGIEIIKLDNVDNFNDISGLASLIDACDFVLSISNTTVHLSGAIGKKTILMLPKGRGKLWYWSKDGCQSHWYKSIKIYEQKNIGDWSPVINNVLEEIKGV